MSVVWDTLLVFVGLIRGKDTLYPLKVIRNVLGPQYSRLKKKKKKDIDQKPLDSCSNIKVSKQLVFVKLLHTKIPHV